MSCDVCIDADFDGSNSFFYRRTPTARKPYKCAECGDVIPSGVQYVRVGGHYEGAMWDEILCANCNEIAQAWYCGGVMYGNIWEDIEYTFDGLTSRSECFLSLSHSAKEHLMRFWWQWKERTA